VAIALQQVPSGKWETHVDPHHARVDLKAEIRWDASIGRRRVCIDYPDKGQNTPDIIAVYARCTRTYVRASTRDTTCTRGCFWFSPREIYLRVVSVSQSELNQEEKESDGDLRFDRSATDSAISRFRDSAIPRDSYHSRESSRLRNNEGPRITMRENDPSWIVRTKRAWICARAWKRSSWRGDGTSKVSLRRCRCTCAFTFLHACRACSPGRYAARRQYRSLGDRPQRHVQSRRENPKRSRESPSGHCCPGFSP